jgi:hypothetical protein
VTTIPNAAQPARMVARAFRGIKPGLSSLRDPRPFYSTLHWSSALRPGASVVSKFACPLERFMKKPSFDIPTFFTAIRTTGALIAGNAVLQWFIGANGLVVAKLLAVGFLVIVITSYRE